MKINPLQTIVALFLIYLFWMNVASQVLFTNAENIDFAGVKAGDKSRNDFSLQDDAIKAAVINEITVYLNQFNNTCFGQSIRIGEPTLFEDALNKKLGTIYVGEEGRQMVAKNTKKGQAYHNSGLLSADIAFAFDPRQLAEGKASFFQRQTMMHEITHHIEWLYGVKESSKDFFGNNNPRSERNTDYQDNVINALDGWTRNEELIKSKKVSPADQLIPWKNFEKLLRGYENGSAAAGNLPDANLQAMTGFRAKLVYISAYYLSGACGEDLRDLVLLSNALPPIKNQLAITGTDEANVGEEAEITAEIEGVEGEEISINPALKPTFSWKIPGAETKTGNPIRFKSSETKNLPIQAELKITLNGREFVIARGEHTLNVKPQSTAVSAVEWKSKWGSINTSISGISNLKTATAGNGTKFTAQANKANKISISGTIQTAPPPSGAGNVTDLEGEIIDPSYTDYDARILIKSDDGATLYTLTPKISRKGDDARFSYLFDPEKLPGKKNLTIEVSVKGGKPEFGTGFVSGIIDFSSSNSISNQPSVSGKPVTSAVQPNNSAKNAGNRFESINGRVEITRDGKPLNTGFNTNFQPGDQIKTGANSSASMKLADVINLLLKSNSLLMVGKSAGSSPLLKFIGGNMQISVPKLPAGNSLNIEMSQADAVVKGTDFELWENGARSIIKVNEGSVAFRNKATGATVNVSAGQTFVASGSSLGLMLGSQPAEEAEISFFSTANDYGVLNGGKSPGFTLKVPVFITYIMTYHWNGGRGASSGGTIAFKNAEGKIFGPWKVSVRKNVYWEANPNITLQPGTYYVIDSDPATWAQNPQSGGFGHTIIKGFPFR